MSKNTFTFGSALGFALGFAALLSVVSCESKDKCQGAERCACYANDTCNAGLECRSDLCVSLSSTGNGGTSATGSGIDTKKCLACAEKSCKTEYDACESASGCLDLMTCALDCGPDANCLAACGKNASAATGQKLIAYETCALTECMSDCVDVPTGTAGASGLGGTASAGGHTGTAGKNQGGSGGASTVQPTTGPNWLTLVGPAAPSTQGVNGKLGIEGVFYAYGDPCATPKMHWDAEARCLSGDLCEADELGTNWGVAIGFDLNNVSETKHAWNATAAGVKGFVWSALGAPFPKLQFWVQNMDPSFSGVCSAANCNINGPPDGTTSASSTGQVLFTNLTKENWGGTGTAYIFNPTQISSLQFKVPSPLDPLISGTGYQICVDQLGVIR